MGGRDGDEDCIGAWVWIAGVAVSVTELNYVELCHHVLWDGGSGDAGSSGLGSGSIVDCRWLNSMRCWTQVLSQPNMATPSSGDGSPLIRCEHRISLEGDGYHTDIESLGMLYGHDCG